MQGSALHPLKGFLKEALKNPKNFKGNGIDRVSFTPNKIGGCCIGALLSINAYAGAPYPARDRADDIGFVLQGGTGDGDAGKLKHRKL